MREPRKQGRNNSAGLLGPCGAARDLMFAITLRLRFATSSAVSLRGFSLIQSQFYRLLRFRVWRKMFDKRRYLNGVFRLSRPAGSKLEGTENLEILVLGSH